MAAPYDENGELYVTESPQRNNTMNPVAKFVGPSKDQDRWIQVNPNFYGIAKLSDAISYRLNFAPSFKYNRHGEYRSSIFNHGASSQASQSADNTIDLLLENIVSYNKYFGKHNIQGTALYSVQKNISEVLSAGVQDLPYETQEFYNLGSAQTITGVGSNLNEWGLTSVMGRLHYGFADKWLITGTLRADGSSRLAEGNKWGFFPSAAIGWRLIEEPFMRNQAIFDDFKLRASFGRVGNTGINPYQTQGGLARASYNFANSNVFGYYPSIIANPNLRWEMTNTINAGFDFSIAEGRLSGSAEFYKQYTSDLILSRQLPYTSGFDNILENVGKTQNTGFEITLQSTPVETASGFVWNSDLTAAYNREKIVELYDGAKDDVGNSWFIGQPVNTWYFYDALGIWQENEADQAIEYSQRPGSVKLKDQDQNMIIDSNDRMILGSPSPNWILGWNNSFKFKGFDMNIYMISRLGQVIKNGYYESLFINAFAQDIHNGLNLNYWTPDNPVNTFPAASNYDLNDFPMSLAYVKGDFVKIRDITLGYTMNKNNFSNLPIDRIRVYFTANNAFIFNKKMEAVNIDVESDDGELGRFDTPQPKAFIIGLNVNF